MLLSGSLGTGNYYLTDGLIVNKSIYIDGEVNLCLSGKTLDMRSHSLIQRGGTLNLCDCKGGSKIRDTFDNSQNSNSYMFQCGSNSSDGPVTLNLYGGTLERQAEQVPFGLMVSMLGIREGSTANLYGGSVILQRSNGETEGHINAIYNKGTLNLSGGTVSNTTGIAIDTRGALTLSGSPTISSKTDEPQISVNAGEGDAFSTIHAEAYTGGVLRVNSEQRKEGDRAPLTGTLIVCKDDDSNKDSFAITLGSVANKVESVYDTALHAWVVRSTGDAPAASYTVTFDGDGGTPATATKTVTAPATTVGELPSAPDKAGYVFGGWFTEKNGGGTQFTATTTVTGNLTVYAKWTAKPAMGGTVTLPLDQDNLNQVFGEGSAAIDTTTSPETIIINNHINAEDTITIPGNVILNLNGNTITGPTGKPAIIIKGEDSDLTVTGPGSVIGGAGAAPNGDGAPAIKNESTADSAVNIEGGAHISGGAGTGTGSGGPGLDGGTGDASIGGSGASSSGNITVEGGSASGGNGGGTTITDGSTSTGGNGGSGTAAGGNGGNGATIAGGSNTVDGGTTGGTGGSGMGSGQGGNGGNGIGGSGSVFGSGTATGGNGGNAETEGKGGMGGAGLQAPGVDGSGSSITETSGKNGLNAKVVIAGNSGTTVKIPDPGKAAEAVLTPAERENTNITGVSVTLTVENKTTDKPDEAKVEEAKPTGTQVGAYFDIVLEKTITENGTAQSPEAVTTAPGGTLTVTITIPTDMRGGSNYVIIRVHGERAECITTTQNGDDLTFETDRFSTYAIAYTKAGGGDPTTGGGSGRPSYRPDYQQPEHGTITVTPTNPSKGDTVTITTKPDTGYVTDQVTVTDKDGKDVPVKAAGDGKFTFTQPSGRVSIVVTYQPASGQGLPFVDVRESDWFYDSVQYIYENGLMNGTSDAAFSPNTTTSRGMAVTIVWRLEGEPAAQGASPFADMPSDAYYSTAIAWAAENGIVNGYGNGSFGPNDPITREQLAAILYRYAQFKAQQTPTEGVDMGEFSDSAQISAYAYEAMRWALEQGVLSGKGDGILAPTGQATRAELATMLARFLTN